MPDVLCLTSWARLGLNPFCGSAKMATQPFVTSKLRTASKSLAVSCSGNLFSSNFLQNRLFLDPKYELLEGDLNKGRKTPVRLWQLTTDKSPIVALKIVTEDTTSVGAGFGRYPEVLNPDAKDFEPKLFLCYLTLAGLTKIQSGVREVGDKLDVLDNSPLTWRV